MKKFLFLLAFFPLVASAVPQDSFQITLREEERGSSNFHHEDMNMGRHDENFRRNDGFNNEFRRPTDVNVNQNPGVVYMPEQDDSQQQQQQPSQYGPYNQYPY